MTNPIVVGFTDSPTGWAALERGVVEARLRRARLVVIHSMQGGDDTPVGEYGRYRELFEGLEDRLTEEGLDHELRELVRGKDPAEDLAMAASDVGAEMIVIGYRRRSPAGKALLGSDAQGILLQAPCPVLAVRPGDDYPD